MRWYVIRILLRKECYRLLANKGGITLLLLLVVTSMLMSFFGAKQGTAANLTAGVQICYVDYVDETDLVRHLRMNVPGNLRDQIKFRRLDSAARNPDGTLLYPQNTGAIQLRPRGSDPQGPGLFVWFWHPGADGSALAPFEAWFWKETLSFYMAKQHQGSAGWSSVSASEIAQALTIPPIETTRSELKGGLDQKTGMATSLLLFGLFFVCVYLQSSLTCEERERGVLLAQALSPASAREILAAKFLFYPILALCLSLLIAGLNHPSILRNAFFWPALFVSVLGSMGVGLTISSVAKTQRAASIGAMCYMATVALLLFICQQYSVPGLPYLALEYHCPRMLHAALTDSVAWYHWWHLAGAALLACAWAGAATWLFRRQGWQ
jgi:hypothetical protein